MPSVKPKKKKLKKEINEVEEPQGNYTYNDLNKIADDLSNTSDIVSYTVHPCMYLLLGKYILMKVV